jgi:hypothetical protein
MQAHTRTPCLLIALAGAFLALSPAMAQHITGMPGAPDATTTSGGRYIPAPPQSFGGTFGLGDFGAHAPTPRLVAQTSGVPATAGATTAAPDGQEESASELNRKLTNPVSSLWSITNQFNNFKLADGHWNNNWNFQPVLPVSLTRDVNLITRPVMPFYNIVPHETAPGQGDRILNFQQSQQGAALVDDSRADNEITLKSPIYVVTGD